MKSIRIFFLLASSVAAGLAACSYEKDPVPPAPFELYVPTAFTPDGDGVNDTFKVKGNNIQHYHIDIFTPSNVLIYASDNINEGWTGTYKGDNMPPDNYLWIIEYVNSRSEKHKSSGYVELVR